MSFEKPLEKKQRSGKRKLTGILPAIAVAGMLGGPVQGCAGGKERIVASESDEKPRGYSFVEFTSMLPDILSIENSQQLEDELQKAEDALEDAILNWFLNNRPDLTVETMGFQYDPSTNKEASYIILFRDPLGTQKVIRFKTIPLNREVENLRGERWRQNKSFLSHNEVARYCALRDLTALVVPGGLVDRIVRGDYFVNESVVSTTPKSPEPPTTPSPSPSALPSVSPTPEVSPTPTPEKTPKEKFEIPPLPEITTYPDVPPLTQDILKRLYTITDMVRIWLREKRSATNIECDMSRSPESGVAIFHISYTDRNGSSQALNVPFQADEAEIEKAKEALATKGITDISRDAIVEYLAVNAFPRLIFDASSRAEHYSILYTPE